MSDSLKIAIDELIAQISEKEAELTPLKIAVNTLCRQVGLPEQYILESGRSGVAASLPQVTWRLDQFTNRGLATSVVDILETRKSRGLDGPATIDEIFDALTAGGYKFTGTSGSDENTKRAVKIALTKNTAQFVKIRDDIFGLKKWYPGASARKPSRSNGQKVNGGDTDSGGSDETLDSELDDDSGVTSETQPEEENNAA